MAGYPLASQLHVHSSPVRIFQLAGMVVGLGVKQPVQSALREPLRQRPGERQSLNFLDGTDADISTLAYLAERKSDLKTQP
jgi:hypothetical protein